MRALFSWDVDRADPQFQQILVDMAGCLPNTRTKPLTNHSALIESTNVKEFNALYQALKQVSDRYAGRLFFVFSLHSENDPIWGLFRAPATALTFGRQPDVSAAPQGGDR
jgi:hypothetical protein